MNSSIENVRNIDHRMGNSMEIPILENPANLILKLTNYFNIPLIFSRSISQQWKWGVKNMSGSHWFHTYPGDRIRSIVVAYCVIPICINWRFPKSWGYPQIIHEQKGFSHGNKPSINQGYPDLWKPPNG